MHRHLHEEHTRWQQQVASFSELLMLPRVDKLFIYSSKQRSEIIAHKMGGRNSL